MRRLQIHHATRYVFDESVTLLPHKLLLRPREGRDIRIESSRFQISPAHQIQWQRDMYDNSVALVAFSEPSGRLSIDSQLILQHFDDWPLDFLVADYAVRYPFNYDLAEQAGLSAFLMPIFAAAQPLVGQWLRPLWVPGQVVETYLLLEWINKSIAMGFNYSYREEPGVQSPVDTIANGSGSCRDFATLFIEACHYLGLAARFVSGYQYSPAVPAGQGTTHAWAEVYLPGAGWKGFDSTSGTIVGNDYIALAVSRHPELVPPVSGSFVATRAQSPVMSVTVSVTEASA